jgi:hypothetical protein
MHSSRLNQESWPEARSDVSSTRKSSLGYLRLVFQPSPGHLRERQAGPIPETPAHPLSLVPKSLPGPYHSTTRLGQGRDPVAHLGQDCLHDHRAATTCRVRCYPDSQACRIESLSGRPRVRARSGRLPFGGLAGERSFRAFGGPDVLAFLCCLDLGVQRVPHRERPCLARSWPGWVMTVPSASRCSRKSGTSR